MDRFQTAASELSADHDLPILEDQEENRDEKLLVSPPPSNLAASRNFFIYRGLEMREDRESNYAIDRSNSLFFPKSSYINAASSSLTFLPARPDRDELERKMKRKLESGYSETLEEVSEENRFSS